MATIYCFSATGNSLEVADAIAAKIDARVVSMNVPVDVCDDDMIGFVFPTFFFGLPLTVREFILRLDIRRKDAYIFAVNTYGGVAWGVLSEVRKLLAEKGCTLAYGRPLKYVENYLPHFGVNDSARFLARVPGNMDAVAEMIAARARKPARYASPLNAFIYSMYPARKATDCDQRFTVATACNSCGTCATVCPRGNIKIESGRPSFQHRCELCLACLHACPVQAIDWDGKTQGKRRYRNPHISLHALAAFNSGNNAGNGQ